MYKTKNIREQHPITDLTSPFTLNGFGFRIYLNKKVATNAEFLEITGKLLGSDTEVTIPVKVSDWSDQIFKEIKTATLTDHDLYFGVEFATQYNVVFDAAGGVMNNMDQHVQWGQLAIEPTEGIPTLADHTFKQWNLGENEYNFATAVTNNITLTAIYQENLTVTFDSAGGSSVDPIQVLEGETITEPTSPTLAGYTFDAWQLNEEDFDFETPITADITLTATWLENFTITFNSDGGSAVTAQEIADGSTATEPTDPTKEGYEFVEWQLDGVAYNFATAVTADITLTATWLEVFTVTFDSQGGSEITAQEVTDGDLATLPDPAPTKDTFTFQYWSLTIDGAEFAFTTPITADTTLYAVWILT